MGNSLGAAIELLRTSTPQLNLIAEKANAIVRRVEQFLAEECRVGTHAVVVIAESPDGDHGKWLEYRRVNGKFRLAVVIGDVAGDHENVKAWSECARDDKLESLSFIPKLIEKLAADVQKAIEENKKAVATIDQLLKALGVPSAQPYADDEQQFRDEDIPF